MKKYSLLIISLLLFCSPLYAQNYVCPGTYKTIATGFTIQQVKAACGKPLKVHSRAVKNTSPARYIQWIYTSSSRNLPNQYQPQMIVTFSDKKVSQVQISNQSTSAHFPCFETGRLKVGMTAQQVRMACGNPKHENRLEKSSEKLVDQTVMTYNFGSYRPEVLFVFENNKLIKIESGQVAK